MLTGLIVASEAEDLRDLARQIEEVCRAHRANSMASELVRMMTDYLCLRAHVMDLHRRLDLTGGAGRGTVCQEVER
jgi:HPt (histidine-containing phosphotransfer) domain-containing protein